MAVIGEKHPLYKTGKTSDSNGYVQLSSMEHGDDCKKREHRVLVERVLGRKLTPDEVVHHKNGDKTDNRIDNLEVMSRADHAREHHAKGAILACAICGARRWYSPANIAKFLMPYHCKQCGGHRKLDSYASVSKLTRRDAEEIRKQRAAGTRGVDLAERYGVSQSTICEIVKGRKWA